MRVASTVLFALVVCAAVYWLVVYQPRGGTQVDRPELVTVGGQPAGDLLSGTGKDDVPGKRAEASRTEHGMVGGYLVDAAGGPVRDVAYGIEKDGVYSAVGLTAADGAWALEAEFAQGKQDAATPRCVFKVNATVDLAVRLSRLRESPREPSRVVLPELADASITLVDYVKGDLWRVQIDPGVKSVDLGEGREVRFKGLRLENQERVCGFRSMAGAAFDLYAEGASFELRESTKVLKLPSAILLRKSALRPRVKVVIVGDDGRVKPVGGLCSFRQSAGGTLELRLRDGVVDLGSWRSLAWDRDYSVFVTLSDCEYFDRAFRTQRRPTREIQEVRLRRGAGKKSVVVSGFKGRKPFSAMFEQASGMWLGISASEVPEGDTRYFRMRPSGEVDVTLMPEGWRRIFFFYRDGDIATCRNDGRRITQVRFLETTEIEEQNLLTHFKELRIKGPCVAFYEVLLPGLVQSREWWIRVDGLRLEATGLRDGKPVIWHKKLPLGMVSRLRFQRIGAPRGSDSIVRIQRK